MHSPYPNAYLKSIICVRAYKSSTRAFWGLAKVAELDLEEFA
jgi:hypothetical protein